VSVIFAKRFIISFLQRVSIARYAERCISYDRITLNDLECPIQLKVRFTDGTLDVRLLPVSESTIRIGVARGGGEWAGGLTPMWAADTLFLCGS